MAKANPIITNFSAGEWSARNEGRVDLEKYYSSCRIIENMLVASQGGVDFRPGTAFITTGKTDSLKIRLIPFSIKGVGEYVVELGNLYARFIKCSTHAQLLDGAVPVEIATPWPTAALFDIKYKQSKTALYFVHPSYSPRILTRTNDTTWVLTEPTFSGWDESTKKYITAITQAAPPVITSVGHTYLTNDIVYIMGVFGMSELNNRAYKITKINDDTYSLNNVDTTTYNPYVSGGTSRKATNIFGSADNYPSAVGFYQQRVVLGGTNNIPDGVWFSEPGEFLNFKMPEGLYFKISHNRGLAIEWLAGKGELIFGADTCEGVIRGGPLVYDNFDLRVESGHGSCNIQGQLIGDRILFVQAGGRRIREFFYHESSGGWESPDLTHFADHITGDGLTEMMVQTNPDTILWCVRSDGVLAALVYEHTYGVFGWSRIVIAGTDAEVESVACVRGTVEDELYISVKRTVDGTVQRFIEYFKPRNFGSDQADAYFVDCGITWDGGDAETITDITQAEPPVVTCAGHPFADGDLVMFTGVVGSDEGIIDFQDFAEVDEGDAITVDSAIQITVDELYRDEEGLLYRHLGHEFLDGAFEYTLKVTLDAFPDSGWSMCGVWGVADEAKHLNALYTDSDNGLAYIIRRQGDTGFYKMQAWEVYAGSSQAITSTNNFALATPYYVKINRTITGGAHGFGNLAISIFSDEGMTTLIETMTADLHSIIKYEYLYAVWNYIDEAHHNLSSYTLENLSGPANRGSWNYQVFKVDDDAANTFSLDDESDNDINGYHYEKYVSGGQVQKVIQTVTGLDHLEGEEVAVLVDGSTHSKETVSGGKITLDRYGNKIHAGLGYSPKLKLMRIEAGGSYGTAQGKKMRIHRLLMRVYKSLNCKVGPDEDHLTTVKFREGDEEMDSPPALFSGDKEVQFNGPWERGGDIYATNDTPTPLNILAIMPELVTND